MSKQFKNTRGYTLLEMITVMTILSIVGLVASFVVLESMKIFARTSPALYAEYQARLASERIKRDIRGMSDTASISALSPTGIAFVGEGSEPIAFTFAGGNLLRNGDLLAQGLSSFALTHWTREGLPVTDMIELHLVEVDLTAQVADQVYRAQSAAFPRCQSR